MVNSECDAPAIIHYSPFTIHDIESFNYIRYYPNVVFFPRCATEIYNCITLLRLSLIVIVPKQYWHSSFSNVPETKYYMKDFIQMGAIGALIIGLILVIALLIN